MIIRTRYLTNEEQNASYILIRIMTYLRSQAIQNYELGYDDIAQYYQDGLLHIRSFWQSEFCEEIK